MTYAPLRRVGAALVYRDFRVLWLGALTSSVGTWMQKVAQNWLVLSLAGASPALFLGLDSFLGDLPILILTLVGGVVADRYDRRRLLIGSQSIQMAAAFTLAVLVAFDVVRLWHVLLLSSMTGFGQAFGGPAYQSLLPSLVDKPDLPNAVALNSIQFNLARVIGPLIAGATLTAFGMVACFGLNGLSFLAVIAAIASLRTKHVAVAASARMRDDLHSGLIYVRRQPALVGLTVLALATTFLGAPLLTFLPLFAEQVFGGGVGQYTLLMVFAGAGAVTGAFAVAWLGTTPRMGRTLLWLQVAYGLLVFLFGVSRLFWLSAALLVLAGAAMVMVTATLLSLVQMAAPTAMRGRIVSIYMVALRGGLPLGSLVAGLVASRWSAPSVMVWNGLLLSLVAVLFLVTGQRVRDL